MFSEILTERLRLRCLRIEDSENMFEYRRDPAVAQYQSWEPRSVGEVRSFIESFAMREFNTPGWYQIGIALRENNILIGDCGIHILETEARIVEIGISIAATAQSKGYATEALHAVLDLLFGELEKHRVFASVDPRNQRSIDLMKRLGFCQEAHFVQSVWFKGSWADDVVFGMLASEWKDWSAAKSEADSR